MKPWLVVVCLGAAACGPRRLGSVGGDAGADVPAAMDGGGVVDLPSDVRDAATIEAAAPDVPPDASTADEHADAVPPMPPPVPPAVKAWEPAGDPDGGVPVVISAVGISLNEMVVGTAAGQVFSSQSANYAQPHWQRIDTFTQAGRTFNLPALPVTSVVVNPLDSMTIYVSFAGSSLGHKVFATHTGGSMWTELGGGLESLSTRDVWTLSMNPQDTQRLYAVTPDSVWYTTDGGNNWSLGQPPDEPLLPPFAAGYVSAMAYGSNVYDVWIAGTSGEIFHSPDTRAVSVSSIATAGLLPASLVTRVTARPGGGVYASFGDGYGDAAVPGARDRLWFTVDNRVWQNLHHANLPGGTLYGLSVNPAFQTTLYLIEPAGAHRSDDGGATWW